MAKIEEWFQSMPLKNQNKKPVKLMLTAATHL
jgi:hypothetical protein